MLRVMREAWDEFLTALTFLTILPGRIPLPGASSSTAMSTMKTLPASQNHIIARSAVFFPMIGALLGGLACVVYLITERLLGNLPAATASLLFMAFATGGLHLDGLADTADGLFSGGDRQRMLEIMRDSRIGTMGVLALVMVLLAKFTLVASLQPEMAWLGLWVAPVTGRTGAVLAAFGAVYAREGPGLGRAFVEGIRGRELAIALLSATVLAAGVGSLPGLIALGMGLLACLIVRWRAEKKLGGLTGDTLGAAIEVGEVAALSGYALCLTLHL